MDFQSGPRGVQVSFTGFFFFFPFLQIIMYKIQLNSVGLNTVSEKVVSQILILCIYNNGYKLPVHQWIVQAVTSDFLEILNRIRTFSSSIFHYFTFFLLMLIARKEIPFEESSDH